MGFFFPPSDLCVNGPTAGGSRDVVPGCTSPAGLNQPADLFPACAIHPPRWSHWTAGARCTTAGYGGVSQSRGCCTIHRWELLLLSGEWGAFESLFILSFFRQCVCVCVRALSNSDALVMVCDNGRRRRWLCTLTDHSSLSTSYQLCLNSSLPI